MRRNKLTEMISATFLLLHRILIIVVHKTYKAASGGMTRLCDWSILFKETLFCHQRGSGVTYQRSNHYHLYSIIFPPFALDLGIRPSQHPQRWKGSGRPPQCWENPIGTWFSLSPGWDTILVPGIPSSMTRSSHSPAHKVGFTLSMNGRERGNRYRTPTPYPQCHTR